MANAPLTRESLHLPARQAVRFVARQRLQRVVDQAARITAAEDAAEAAISFTAELATMSGEAPAVLPDDRYAADPEAVHDLRVALRRLRSWLRAFHPYLDDTVKRGTERRLRRLAQIAGRARDLEVQSHWLRALPASTPPLALEAARALDARDVRSYGVARRKLARAVTEELPKLAARLESQLKHYVLDVDVDAPVREPSLASAMAPMLRAHRACVTEAITAITTRDQLDVVHAARIEVKRMRYLLETLDDVSRAAHTHGRRLAMLQGVFGELHDAQVLHARVAGYLASGGWRRDARTAHDTAEAVEPPRRAWTALQRGIARRVNIEGSRSLRAAHAHTTDRSLAAIDGVARWLERMR